MRALRILNSGAFTPEDVDRLQQAFDTAWQPLAPSIEKAEQPKARETLATIIVAAGNVSELDAEELASFALRTFEAVRAGQESPS